MRLTAEQWRDVLLSIGIQASDAEAEWLETASDSLLVDRLPRLETEPQLVQATTRWGRKR